MGPMLLKGLYELINKLLMRVGSGRGRGHLQRWLIKIEVSESYFYQDCEKPLGWKVRKRFFSFSPRCILERERSSLSDVGRIDDIFSDI